MRCVFGPIKAILRMPYKVGIFALLVGLGIYLGSSMPTLSAYGKEAVMWLKSSGDENFDPEILERPEKELDLIQTVNNSVQPKLKKAQILIRKQQAQIAYMREQCEFMKMKVRPDENDTRPVEQILSELAVAVQDGTLSEKQRKLYQSVGQTWIALQNRIEISTQSLQELFALETRINFLQGKLDERRLATLRYVPERIPCSDVRTVVIEDIEEAQNLLQDVHETLFKTVVSLNPEMLKDTHALLTANYSN